MQEIFWETELARACSTQGNGKPQSNSHRTQISPQLSWLFKNQLNRRVCVAQVKEGLPRFEGALVRVSVVVYVPTLRRLLCCGTQSDCVRLQRRWR